jgi:hypothetical protein
MCFASLPVSIHPAVWSRSLAKENRDDTSMTLSDCRVDASLLPSLTCFLIKYRGTTYESFPVDQVLKDREVLRTPSCRKLFALAWVF